MWNNSACFFLFHSYFGAIIFNNSISNQWIRKFIGFSNKTFVIACPYNHPLLEQMNIYMVPKIRIAFLTYVIYMVITSNSIRDYMLV